MGSRQGSVQVEQAVGQSDHHAGCGLGADHEPERDQGTTTEDQQVAGRIGLDALDRAEDLARLVLDPMPLIPAKVTM